MNLIRVIINYWPINAIAIFVAFIVLTKLSHLFPKLWCLCLSAGIIVITVIIAIGLLRCTQVGHLQISNSLGSGTDSIEPILHNIPRIGSFFGRERELNELQNRIVSNTARVININGPPGFGKSKLAIQLGHELVRHHSDILSTVRYIDTESARKS